LIDAYTASPGRGALFGRTAFACEKSAFIDHDNHARYPESLSNLTPAEVYFGRAEGSLLGRESIKRQTIANRR
jgi:hypothetical protein